MFTRLSALAVVLAMGAGALVADDKDTKKDSKAVKGKVVKFDRGKKSITLKTADGEKEFTTGDEILIVMATGPRLKASLKKETEPKTSEPSRRRDAAILGYVLRDGNELELILGDKDIVTEVHFNNRPVAPPTGRPAGAPPAKPPAKTDGQK
jgi:hypothetical protein